MAQFILGNSFKDYLNRRPFLRNFIWRLESLFLGALLQLLSWMPADAVSRTGRRLGQLLGPRLGKHKAILRNLRLAFPGKNEQEIASIADGIWGNAGSVLTEFACMRKICRPDRVQIVLHGYVEGFNRSDKPVILVTAHLSNWEILAYAISQMVKPLSAPYTAPSNPWLARKLEHYRKPFGVQLFERDSSMRPLVEQIAQGQSLIFLADQRVDSGKPVEFFGLQKLSTIVPARLGLRYGCEVVPVRVERLQNARYRVSFYPPVTADNPQAEALAQAIDITTKMNRLFESWIRERPEEWFCSNRMWPKQLERQLAENQPT